MRNTVVFVALLFAGAPGLIGQDVQTIAAAKQLEQTRAAMAPSIETQVAHFRKAGHKDYQSTSGGFFVTEAIITTPPDEAASGDCEPLSPLKLEGLVMQASKEQGVSAGLLRAVIRQESGGRPCVVSPKGAMGLMQLMPGTAGDLGVTDALDPEANVRGGAQLLKTLLDRYAGDLNRALGAYNAGPARVDEVQGVPLFPETVHYVDSIMRGLDKPH